MSFYLKKYMWLISLIAVVFCSYFLARMTTDIVAMKLQGEVALPTMQANASSLAGGKKTVKESESNDVTAFQKITERNVFDSHAVATITLGTGPKTEAPTTVDLNGEAVLTTLPIKLISTFAVGGGTDKLSSCVISGGANKQEVYTVHDEKKFASDADIVKILYDRVEFVNKGKLEYVPLVDFVKGGLADNALKGVPTDVGGSQPKVEQAGEGKFVIDRAELDDAIANIDKLYTQIRATPHFKDGVADGLKLSSIRAGSIFAKLGLQRGDVLKRMNGIDLDIKKGLDIFNQLKNETHITIDLDRKGAPTTLDYEIR